MASSLYIQHLTNSQLENISQYKYRGEDRSITHKYVMTPFYNHIVNYIPLWMAPNTITLIGFLLTTSVHIITMYCNPTLTQPLPSFLYLSAGIALFIYMTLDNLDGKQARRTNSSSPLGQLFDHGCDALNVTISAMTIISTLQLGAHWTTMFLLFLVGQFMVFMATLEEYYTGAMILPSVNGPNEGLITISLVHIITAILGPKVWTSSISLFSSNGTFIIKINQIVYLISIISALNINLINFVTIINHIRLQTTNKTNIWIKFICHLFPIVLFAIVFHSWAYFAPSHFQSQVVIILWISGGLTFDLISRLMLSHLAKSSFPYFQKLMIPVLFCVTNSILNEQMKLNLLDVHDLTYLVFGFVTIYNGWRIWCLLKQLCHFLNIRCFSLQPLHENKQKNL